MLLTDDQARAHVRASSDEDVAVYLGAAEQAAADFLGRQVYPTPEDMAAAVLAGTSGDDPMVVNDAIKAAVLLIFGHLYRNREDVITGASAAAVVIPMGSRTLLWPHRVGLGV
ncbi:MULTISPECIES: head-tail connector protein [Luteibacter]|uniref:head-tail connector protein n=1 Tax=Luteibacter TaxID=242605 RepID=UPI000560FFBC|nr:MULTISPECIES: head-tail connector protein [unclassified Luteibacter]